MTLLDIKRMIAELGDEKLAEYADILHVMANGMNAQVSLSIVAFKLGRSVPDVAWDMEVLRLRGLVERWEKMGEGYFCLTPLAAQKFRLKLVEADAGWKWTHLGAYERPEVIARQVPLRIRQHQTGMMLQRYPRPDQEVIYWEWQHRGRRVILPKRFLGMDTLCPHIFTICPACHHLDSLRQDEYCIVCDRWGRDISVSSETELTMRPSRLDYVNKREKKVLDATRAKRRQKIRDRIKAAEAARTRRQ